MGPIFKGPEFLTLETSVRNLHSTLRYIPKERKSCWKHEEMSFHSYNIQY